MRLIDADALIKKMETDAPSIGVVSGLMNAWFYATVKSMPTIERHGRWIKMTGMMPPEYHGHYECSECGWHMKGLRNSWTREEEMAYCPNCGARMDE